MNQRPRWAEQYGACCICCKALRDCRCDGDERIIQTGEQIREAIDKHKKGKL